MIDLIKREVVPAIGCTEPIAVSLCVAKATEILGCLPDRIELHLSANIIKNAMGVGIPGTGMVGLPIAVALGAIIGKSEYELEVLRDCTNEAVEAGKRYIDEKRISIDLKDTEEKLYIECVCSKADDRATAIIVESHSNFVHLSKNNEVILHKEIDAQSSEEEENDINLTLHRVYDFAMSTPIDNLRFILESKKLNSNISNYAFDHEYGHNVGNTIFNSMHKYNIFGDTTYMHILANTAAGCDARMGGAPIAVMSNSGSGNQGLSATMPVVTYAKDNDIPEDMLIRALTLSHLTVIYIKQSLGRLSALCGCVVAATGSACAITYMMGGSFEQISFAAKNMVASLTGMLCDGAKPSCALKVASGVSTALMCALLAIENKSANSLEGIIDDCVDKSIINMTSIGNVGMLDTDKMVLDIMTSK